MHTDGHGWVLTACLAKHRTKAYALGLLLPVTTCVSLNASSQDRSYHQTGNRSIKLHPIDTSNTVVLETPFAAIHFSRLDLIERTQLLSEELGFSLEEQIDLLRNERERIHVHVDSIYHPIGEGIHARRTGTDPRDQIAWVLEMIAPDLLLDGRALPIKSSTGLPAQKRIRCKVERDEPRKDLWLPPGNRSLVFRFKDGTEIHRIVTALGE